MITWGCWLLLLLLDWANGEALAYSNCSTAISIKRTESGCSQSDGRGMVVCGELQSALSFIVNTTSNNSSSPEDCVLLLIPEGEAHYITAPMFLDGINVHFLGVSETEDLSNRSGLNGSGLQLPSVVCDYSIQVDLDKIFDLSYIYTDYVLYFNYSTSISFENIEMMNCPYPIRLDTVEQIIVHNSLFT